MNEKVRMLCENKTASYNLVRKVRSSELDLKYENINQAENEE